MLAHHGRALLLAAGLLAAVASGPALADDLATVQQASAGQALVGASDDPASPAVAQESFVAETNGRTTRPGRMPARDLAQRRQAGPKYYAVAAPRSCAHLGCRGIQVLGVGY
jgi:hypothetical protein